jgi:hypothetical protein
MEIWIDKRWVVMADDGLGARQLLSFGTEEAARTALQSWLNKGLAILRTPKPQEPATLAPLVSPQWQPKDISVIPPAMPGQGAKI